MASLRRRQALAIMLAFILVVSLAACSSNAGPAGTMPQAGDAQAQTERASALEKSAEEILSQVEASWQRSHRTRLQGGGGDIVTLMIYLCGSGLESRDGSATIDLLEIMDADISENLNIM